MELKIMIDEEQIKELVEKEIVKQIMAERTWENREAKYGIREGVDKAIKQYIYKEKDNIINRVVERATAEMVKKGLSKLLENIGKDEKL